MNKADEGRKVVYEHHFDCCGVCANLFGLGYRYSAILWGIVFVAIGGVWIVANVLNLQDWGRWAVPILLLGLGFALLLRRRSQSE